MTASRILGIVAAVAVGTIAGLRWRARRGDRSAITMVDPRTLLFSLPTISESLPDAERTGLADGERNAGFLHEDSWRQQEFLPVAAATFVAGTLEAMRSHRAVHAVGQGFREIFARPDGPLPLVELGLTLPELFVAFGSESLLNGVYFSTEPLGRIRDSFGCLLPDIGFLYGSLQGDSVAHLGIALVGSGYGALDPLASFMDHYQLLLVDWLRETVVMPGDTRSLQEWVAAAVREDPEAVI